MRVLYEPVAVKCMQKSAYLRCASSAMISEDYISTWMPQSGERHWGNLRRWISKCTKSKYPSIENLSCISNDMCAARAGIEGRKAHISANRIKGE